MKYICTGTQPPLSDGGKSFILDPRLIGRPLVLAQIRFSFRIENDRKDVLAVRSFQLSQKKAKREFKATESVLRVKDIATGESQSISQRCAEMEKLVPQLMGVSKSVLENVIFVHQEDANWPLGDAKSLKTKFDEIFNATRYTKALEAIAKLKKEKNSEIKLMDVELSQLRSDQEFAHNREDQLRKTKETIINESNSTAILKEEISKIEEELSELHRAERESSNLRSKIEEFETRAKLMKEEMVKAQERMNAVYDDSDEELEKGLIDNESKAENSTARIAEILRSIQRAEIEIEKSEEKYSTLVKKLGAMESQEIEHSKKKIELEAIGRRIKEKYSIEKIQPENFQSTAAAIQEFLQRRESEATQCRNSAAASDSQQESAISNFKVRQAKLIDAEKSKIETARLNLEKFEKIRAAVVELEEKLKGNENLELEMNQATEEIQKFEEIRLIENCRKEIESLQRSVDSHSQTLQRLQFERKSLASQQEEVAALKVKQKILEEKAQKFNSMSRKINENGEIFRFEPLPSGSFEIRERAKNQRSRSEISSGTRKSQNSKRKCRSGGEARASRGRIERERIEPSSRQTRSGRAEARENSLSL